MTILSTSDKVFFYLYTIANVSYQNCDLFIFRIVNDAVVMSLRPANPPKNFFMYMNTLIKVTNELIIHTLAQSLTFIIWEWDNKKKFFLTSSKLKILHFHINISYHERFVYFTAQCDAAKKRFFRYCELVYTLIHSFLQ